MALSPSELIQIANAKYQRPKSQIGELSDIINQGIDGYGQAKNQRLDIHRKLIEQEMAEEQLKAHRADMAFMQERGLSDAVKSIGVQPTPADPKQRVGLLPGDPTITITGGKVSRTYKPPEEAKPPNSLEEILAAKVRSGEMTIEDAFKQKQAGSGSGGPSLDLMYRMQKDAAEAAKGKQLAAPSVLAVNEGKGVARMLPEVEKALVDNADIFGPVGGTLGRMNPYNTQAQTVDARMRTASQAFGRFMEGGVLRKEDEEKYRKMFPQLSDTPDVAKNKLAIARRMLAEKFESDKSALGNSGYDVSGLGELEIPPSIFDNAKTGAGGGVQPGTVEDGYRFLGGDPSDPSAWEKL